MEAKSQECCDRDDVETYFEQWSSNICLFDNSGQDKY